MLAYLDVGLLWLCLLLLAIRAMRLTLDLLFDFRATVFIGGVMRPLIFCMRACRGRLLRPGDVNDDDGISAGGPHARAPSHEYAVFRSVYPVPDHTRKRTHVDIRRAFAGIEAKLGRGPRDAPAWYDPSVTSLHRIDGNLANTALYSDQAPLEASRGHFECEWTFADPLQRALPPRDRRVIFYCHGGGWYCPIVGFRRFAHNLSRAAGMSVFMPDYRVLPEKPWPVPLRDILAAFAWLTSPDGGGVAPEHVVVAGESAGGSAVLSLILEANTALRGKIGMPAGCCALSPYCDLTHDYPSFETRQRLDWVVHHESACMTIATGRDADGGELDPRDPSLSPALRPLADFEGGDLPFVYVWAGEYEILQGAAEKLVQERLWPAGIEYAYGETAYGVHMMHLWSELVPEAEEALQELSSYCKMMVRRRTQL